MSRVTIDYTAGAQQGAGIGRYTRELVQALGRLDTTTTYTLLVRGDIRVAGSVDGFPANFRLRRIPIANRTFLRLWRVGVPLAGEWLAGAADVYYSPDFTLPPLRGGRAAVTIHDLSFLRVPETADAGLRAYLSAAVPRAVTRADHVFADSAHTRQDLIDPNALDDFGTPEWEYGTQLYEFAQFTWDHLDRLSRVRSTAEEKDAVTVDPGVYGPHCDNHTALRDNGKFFVDKVSVGGALFSYHDTFRNWLLGSGRTVVLEARPTQEPAPKSAVCSQ